MKVMTGPDLNYFLWSVALGGVLALLYDALRLSRRIIRTADILVNIEDILFIILAGSACAYTAYTVNNGSFRIYGLISTVLGFFIYRLLLKDRLVNVLMLIYGFIQRIFLLIGRALLFVVRFVLKIVGKPLFIVKRLPVFHSKKCEKKQ